MATARAGCCATPLRSRRSAWRRRTHASARSSPFKLDGTASLTQLQPKAGQKPAQLNLRASGDLDTTELAANGQSGAATGDARFTLAPFEPIPLRAMTINGRGIDPGFFNPALPSADLSIAISARIAANRDVEGSVSVDNLGPAGTIDQQRLPLRAMRGKLGGNLAMLQASDVLVDFGAAGKFTGSGAVQRSKDDTGLGTAEFVLHTDRLDLKSLHSRMKSTRIAGDIKLANSGNTQTLIARLAESSMRLDARATLADNLLTIEQARVAAGKGTIDLAGSAGLTGEQAFKVTASAAHFDPASFGDYPGGRHQRRRACRRPYRAGLESGGRFRAAPEPPVQPAACRARASSTPTPPTSATWPPRSRWARTRSTCAAASAPRASACCGTSTANSFRPRAATCMARSAPAASSPAPWPRRAPASSSTPMAWAGRRPRAKPTTACCTPAARHGWRRPAKAPPRAWWNSRPAAARSASIPPHSDRPCPAASTASSMPAAASAPTGAAP